MLDCLKFTNFGQILNVNEQSFLFLGCLDNRKWHFFKIIFHKDNTRTNCNLLHALPTYNPLTSKYINDSKVRITHLTMRQMNFLKFSMGANWG